MKKLQELMAFMVIALGVAIAYYMIVAFGQSCYYGHAKPPWPIAYCLLGQIVLLLLIKPKDNEKK